MPVVFLDVDDIWRSFFASHSVIHLGTTRIEEDQNLKVIIIFLADFGEKCAHFALFIMPCPLGARIVSRTDKDVKSVTFE